VALPIISYFSNSHEQYLDKNAMKSNLFYSEIETKNSYNDKLSNS